VLRYRANTSLDMWKINDNYFSELSLARGNIKFFHFCGDVHVIFTVIRFLRLSSANRDKMSSDSM